MAADPRLLIDWIRTRLLLAATTSMPLPKWPPSSSTLRALEDGRYADAIEMPCSLQARYEIRRRLRPDCRHLFVAYDLHLEREVALKIFLAATARAREATLVEARLAAAIRHPHIITVHEVDPGGGYMVVELLDTDLRDLLGIPRALLLDALCQAGRGLAAAHASGIHHRDLRLENIFVQLLRDPDGRVSALFAKVADFGRATAVDAAGSVHTRGQRAGCAARDQFDFAFAAWECLTGGRRPPVRGELIPKQLHAVLSKALMPNPRQRWADMSALVDAIERVRGATAASRRESSAVVFADRAKAGLRPASLSSCTRTPPNQEHSS